MSSAPNVSGAAIYTRPGGCAAATGAGTNCVSTSRIFCGESRVLSGRGLFMNLAEEVELAENSRLSPLLAVQVPRTAGLGFQAFSSLRSQLQDLPGHPELQTRQTNRQDREDRQDRKVRNDSAGGQCW